LFTQRLLPTHARKFAADLNVVLSAAELLVEIAAANGSICAMMSIAKRLASGKLCVSKPCLLLLFKTTT